MKHSKNVTVKNIFPELACYCFLSFDCCVRVKSKNKVQRESVKIEAESYLRPCQTSRMVTSSPAHLFAIRGRRKLLWGRGCEDGAFCENNSRLYYTSVKNNSALSLDGRWYHISVFSKKKS